MLTNSLDSSVIFQELHQTQWVQENCTNEWAKKAWTYLLTCADSTLYCGSTTNLERRVNEHNAPPGTLSHKGAKYTRGRQPVVLVWSEEQISLSMALKRECQIKQMSRVQKEALLHKNP